MKRITTGLYRAEWDVVIKSISLTPKWTPQYYHYTNAKSKTSIVNGKELDFCLSNTRDFLDRNEGIAILEPYYHACGRLYETGKIDREFFLLARSVTPRKLRKYQGNLWVLCLTPHGCSPFMKERYAAKDGWIISFQMLAIDDFYNYFPPECGRVRFVQMQYSFKRMQHRLESALSVIYKEYKKDKAAKIPNTDRELKKLLLRTVSLYSIQYKSAEYKCEEEVRLICSISDGFSSWTYTDGEITLKTEGQGKKKTPHLILGEKYFYQATQEMKKTNDKRLNMFHIDQKTIQRIINEK